MIKLDYERGRIANSTIIGNFAGKEGALLVGEVICIAAKKPSKWRLFWLRSLCGITWKNSSEIFMRIGEPYDDNRTTTKLRVVK